jgi:hypothetical protein
VNLDAPFTGEWITKEERARLVAEDPVAAAKFFHHLVDIWLHKFLGVTDGKQENDPGVLGRVSGYFGTVETQGRGSLHLHILVWLHGSKNLEEMENAMQDPVFADDFKKYLSRVISEQYPDGEIPPSDLPPENTLNHVCCDRPPHPEDANYDVTSKTHLTRLVAACNVHKHTQTCYKYGHRTCRFGFERPEVEISHFKDGVIYLQRKKGNGWVNNYNSIMLQILRCNTDMKFICNGMDSKALTYRSTSRTILRRKP